MTIPDNWAIFIVGLVLAALQWIFTNGVIKRIDTLETNSEKNIEKNECAHEKIWIELHKIDKQHGERIASVETRIDIQNDIEQSIKKLMSTT